MKNWLIKRLQNSRVYTCIKEVKWDLEESDNTRRAILLILAQLFRIELFEQGETVKSMINHPQRHNREDLTSLYWDLETIRNEGKAQLERTKRMGRGLGWDLPDFAIDHAKNTERGMEIWMSTIGAGIVPDKRSDVQEIWGYLSGSISSLDEAMSALRQMEDATSTMTAMPHGLFFSNIDWSELSDICRFVPEEFER